jgi:ATP-dependent DNA helicase RecG
MSVAQPSEPRPLSLPVTILSGVGPERAEQLARLGIRIVEDVLLHRPRRYEDRRHFRPIAELAIGEQALCKGTVAAMGVKWWNQHRKSVFEMVLDDGTSRLHCRWWNLPYMEKYFSRGDEVVVFGKVCRAKPRTMDHPEAEVVDIESGESPHMSRITPVYPLTEGMPQKWLRKLIRNTLREYGSHAAFPEAVERTVAAMKTINLPTRTEALQMLHNPVEMDQAEIARRRLAFDEFLVLQSRMRRRRKNFQQNARGLPCKGNNRLMKPFLARLEFTLTDAQKRVLREIRTDMGGEHPMRRLLQGDVGSGKTLVAVCCAIMALESGYDVAMMAPTEILAEQHFRTLRDWLVPLGINVEILTGTHKGGSGAQAGPANSIYIGTHALIHAGFNPPSLGLVIIDEQHKFGVAQRELLLRKGRYPHLLVMTATPIPRTLALTLYSDLDSSILDQAPAGRGKIRTWLRPQSALPKVWEFLNSKLKEGRQAYIIYPRVDNTEGNVKAVTKEASTIQAALAPHRVGLLHGRLPSAEKERTMAGFRSNEVSAIVATSLVEVGVDVPNATIMVIESAEQFGLAQLHQLRGRIGRGPHPSHCILVSGSPDPQENARLRVLESSSDGFEIAEADLKIRGPGEFFGHEQSGSAGFRFGDLRTDLALIRAAQQCAAELQEQT